MQNSINMHMMRHTFCHIFSCLGRIVYSCHYSYGMQIALGHRRLVFCNATVMPFSQR